MMVSSRATSDISKFDSYSTRTDILNSWIVTVRYKKGLIRKQRKHRDLRVAAVLHLAITKAEMELRRKQYERSQRWAQVRSQYGDESWSSSGAENVREGAKQEEEEERASRLATSVVQATTTGDVEVEGGGGQAAVMEEEVGAQQKAVDDDYDDDEFLAQLWTSELLGLDNLFNDLNQIKTTVER